MNELEVAPVAPAVELPVRPDPAMLGRENVIAELQRRGALPNPGAIPSLRNETRKLELKKLAGSLDRVDVENELAKRRAKTELRAQPTEAELGASDANRARVATNTAGLASNDPNERAKVLNEERNRSAESAYAQMVGRLPDHVAVPANAKPKAFNSFFNEKFSTVINGQQDPRFPLGSVEDNQLRAQNYNRLFADPKIQEQYQAYTEEVAQRVTPLKRGTPEYYDELEKAVREKTAQEAYNAAKLKALPGTMEAEAKAKVEAPAKVAESSKKLREEIQGNKALENNRLKLAASEQIRNITSKPNPSNQDDLALIYAMVRALDPVSAVREGEVSLLKKGAGLPEQIVIEWNRLFGKPNAVLSPTIRQNIADIAEQEERTARVLMKPELERYSRVAGEQGLTPDQIFTDVERSVMSGQAGTTPGASAPAGPTITISKDETANAPTVANANSAPPTAKFIRRASDGKIFPNPNYKR